MADATRKRRGILVFNPQAGGRDRRAEMAGVVARAKARLLDLELLPTERAGHATELVREGLAKKPDLVVVAGGDGTIAEAAAALVGSETPLAILPAGTTNVVAREYGIPRTQAEAEEILHSKRTRRLTVFPVLGRTSLIGVGVGFDARVMKNIVPILKRLFGRTGIGWTATIEWLRYEFPRIAVDGIDADGKAFSREATFVLSANCRRYGGEPILSPDANPENDLLELVLFTDRSRGTLIRFYNLLSKGKAGHLGVRGVQKLAVKEFTARSLAGYELDVQVDGDCVGTTPVKVGPAAGTVRLVVPDER